MPGTCAIVGLGRAGGSFRAALTEVGWTVLTDVDRDVDRAFDLVLLTVPDAAIADVAASIPPTDAVVAHVSGACDLDVLAPHARVGSIHPLMSLPDPETGSRRLLDHCTFAVDGDPLMADIVAELGGRAIEVPGPKRALYHATAAIAANHLTALCAQVESLAAEVGVPVDAYWTLMSTTLDNIAARRPRRRPHRSRRPRRLGHHPHPPRRPPHRRRPYPLPRPLRTRRPPRRARVDRSEFV